LGLGNNKKLLMILLSLVVATVANATPTMSDSNKSFVAGAVSPTTDAPVLYIPETSQITEQSKSHLAAIGAEILKPPPDFTDFSTVGAEALPPVPAALFMVLTGFLCVSLVKDRRVWLAALVGLLWVGQAGFQAIPQLAAHIRQKHNQRKSPANIACLHRIEDSCRLRSDIEGTQYIGLLHHLAGIPDRTMSSIRSPMSFLRKQQESRKTVAHLCSPFVARNSFARTKSNAKTPQFAITHLSSLLIPAVICPAARAEQNTHFSPAFIFQLLPRGPPNFT